MGGAVFDFQQENLETDFLVDFLRKKGKNFPSEDADN